MNVRHIFAIVGTLLATTMTIGCGGGGSVSASNSTSPSPTPPSLTIESAPRIGIVGSPLTINWTGNNVNHCTVSGNNVSGSVPATGTIIIIPSVTGPQTYTVGCDGASATLTLNVTAQFTYLPDPAFEAALVALGINNAADAALGRISTSAAMQVTQLSIAAGDVSTYGANAYSTSGINLIHDVTGIESFVNLETLRLENQRINSINLTNLTQLHFLSLWGDPIVAIDLTGNPLLQTLGLSETGLSTLDLTHQSALIELDIQNITRPPYTTGNGTNVVGFSSIDLSQQANLQRLHVSNNNFTSLNLVANRALMELWADNNRIANVNIAGYADLNYIILNNNQLVGTLDITDTANNGLPSHMYADGNVGLEFVKVNSISAVTNHIAATAPTSGWYFGAAALVGGN